jgi:hypothetical protein
MGVLAATMIAAAGTPAAAEVLEATYRGTMVCDTLPFVNIVLRGAIEVTVTGDQVRYSQVVRLRELGAEPAPEQGTGKISGQHVDLQGAWKHGDRRYEAKYSGDFVRRSATLKGTQTWTVGGRAITRACTGAIKRPLKAFLPKKPA